MEGARRATGISSSGRTGGLAGLSVVPDSEVSEKAVRRRFTAEYKRRILQEAEACKEQGRLGALLRREGLYSSNLITWRRQAERGTLEALSPKKRGPKEKKPDPSLRRIAELEKATQKLEHKLRQAELIIAAQKKNCRDIPDVPRSQGRDDLMKITESLAKAVNVQQACVALAVPRSSFYRWQKPEEDGREERPRSVPPLSLSGEEEKAVLEILHADRFVDQAPLEIYNTLLDEGNYLCSVRTMYRILEKHEEVKERRNQLTHPPYQKPELLACAPNQLWSWDITKLKGPVKWTYYYLYVILDVFSRYVVGWMVAHRELSSLAQKLIEQTCEKQNIQPGRLTIHADRGPSMKSKPVAFLMADLGITKSHSRPHVSNDNPYSESQFKTLKYRPDFPERFGAIVDARLFCQPFFRWYNSEHYHSGIGCLTPEDVHYGRAEQIVKERQAVLNAAYEKHPKRFKGKPPTPAPLPQAVWINKPALLNSVPALH
ncbi:MAG: IS3 family transposase [Desulfuromonadales bacterium]|nr:IS3 family transposase [Desulfuromonadales bacterium]